MLFSPRSISSSPASENLRNLTRHGAFWAAIVQRSVGGRVASLREHSIDLAIDLARATDALATALALEDPRLVGVVTRSMRVVLGMRAGHMPPHHDGLAVQSLLLRQLERAAYAGDFRQAKPIFSAFRSAAG